MSKDTNKPYIDMRLNPKLDSLFIFPPDENDNRKVIEVTEVEDGKTFQDVCKKAGVDEKDIRGIALHLTRAWTVNVYPGVPGKQPKVQFIDNGEPNDIVDPKGGDNIKYWMRLLRSTGFARDFRASFEQIKNNPVFWGFDVVKEIVVGFKDTDQLSYGERFGIENQRLRALAFENIDISEMIEDLGSKRKETAGKHVKRKKFLMDPISGKPIKGEDGRPAYEWVEKDNIYEVHEVDITKLIEQAGNTENNSFFDVGRAQTKIPVLKVWCTSTAEPHWLFLNPGIAKERNYDPLECVASTFVLQRDLLDDEDGNPRFGTDKQLIDEIYRQGDLLFYVFKDPENQRLVDPSKPTRPLTWEEYDGMLVSET